MRGHVSCDDRTSPKRMATPEPTQDMGSASRVAMAPGCIEFFNGLLTIAQAEACGSGD